jgi:hypothetical protein
MEILRRINMGIFTTIGIIMVLFIIELFIFGIVGSILHKMFQEKEIKNGKPTDSDIYCAFIFIIFLLNLFLALIMVTPDTFGLQEIPTVSENSISENNIK